MYDWTIGLPPQQEKLVQEMFFGIEPLSRTSGDRWDSNPQRPRPQPGALPKLSYGHSAPGGNRTPI